MISGWIKRENGFPKTFFLYSTLIPCVKRQSFVQLSWTRELGIITSWPETWDNLPLFWFHIWKSPESFIEFICSCILFVEPVLCSCTVGHMTAWYSRHDSDVLLCTQTSWAQVGSQRKQISSLCTTHFAPVSHRLPRLYGSGAGIPGIGILIYSWYCGIVISSDDGICSGSRDACLLGGLTAQMIEVRQQSPSTAMNEAVSGLAEAVRTMGQSVSKPHPQNMSRKVWPVRTWQRFGRPGLHVQRIRGYTRSCLSCFAENSETTTNSGDGDSTTLTAVFNIAVHPHDAHTERSTGSGEGSWKKRFWKLKDNCDARNVRSGRQQRIIRANHALQVWFQHWRRGRPSERISGTGETIRWGERYRSRSRPNCISVHHFEHAWASEHTHIQLNVAELWNFNALRMATEDYL